MYDKFQIILDDYINGNKHNFRGAIKKLNRTHLLQFIQFWSEQEMESEGTIIKILINELSLR